MIVKDGEKQKDIFQADEGEENPEIIF